VGALLTNEELEQIMAHARRCGAMAVPSEQEAKDLLGQVQQGDVYAAERICKLYHSMVVPATAPEREAVSIIFEAYAKHIKPNFAGDMRDNPSPGLAL